MAGTLKVDAVMEALLGLMPTMTLNGRIKSLCVRVKWLLSQSSAEYIFTPEELEILLTLGCKNLDFEGVVYSTPDDYFEKINACLGREIRRLETTTACDHGYHSQQEIALIKRTRNQLCTLDNLEKFYLSEWIIGWFSKIERERKKEIGAGKS